MGSILFTEIKIAGLTLKNRILMSAAAIWKSDINGDISFDVPILHFEIAKGGPAMIINGGVGGVHLSGRRASDSPLFNNDERIASHKKYVEGIQNNGAKIAFQATHSGYGAANYQCFIGKKPFVPSFFPRENSSPHDEKNGESCPATEEEIRSVISAYGDSARRAKYAGYDAIEIHSAHESLLMQWLSPKTNTRKDDWGGKIENRCRIHREILHDMKKKAGFDFPVIIKLGMEDDYEDGIKLQESLKVVEMIVEDGNADAIETSNGLYYPPTDFEKSCMKTGIAKIGKEAYFREWTKKVKQIAKDRVLVIMQGGLRTPSLMEEAINSGEADLVSMCRPYIRERAVVRRWKSGDMSKATCISCNACLINLHSGVMICQLDKESEEKNV